MANVARDCRPPAAPPVPGQGGIGGENEARGDGRVTEMRTRGAHPGRAARWGGLVRDLGKGRTQARKSKPRAHLR